MAAVIVAHGQGKIDFSNYFGNTSDPKVTWGTGTPPNVNGLALGSEFKAQLLYYVGTSVTDIPFTYSQMTAIPSPLPLFGQSLTGNPVADGGAYAGWFEGGVVQIPSVTGANYNFVSFAIVAYSASERAVSAIFQSPTSASSGDLTPSFVPGSWQNFSIDYIPEPSTLALTALGGLVSLAMFRRKKM